MKTKNEQQISKLAQKVAEQLSETRKRGLRVRTGLVGGEALPFP